MDTKTMRETWDARVRGLGKYEGEPGWVALAWEEIVLQGCADCDVEIDGVIVSICDLDEDVRAAWPDAPERCALYEREDGFVMRADLALVLRELRELEESLLEDRTDRLGRDWANDADGYPMYDDGCGEEG